MKKTLMSIIILFLICSLAQAQEKPRYVLKMCAIAPEGTSWAEVAYQFADYVYEKSGGRMKMVWYLGGAMGEEFTALKKVRLGQLQGGVFTLAGLAKIVPEIRVIGLPNLFRDYDEVDYVMGKMASAFKRMFEEKGFVLFDWIEVGLVYFFSQHPIHTFDDIKKTKLWYWKGESVQKEIFELMGYNKTVPLEVYELLMGLRTGMVDTFYSPLYPCLALQWYQHAKYINMAPYAYTPSGLLVTKEVFDGLPKDLRDIFWDACRKYLPNLTPMIRSDHEKALKGFVKHGMKALEPTPEIEEEIDRKSREIYEKLGDKYYPKWLLAGILNARARFRAGLTE